MKRFILVIFLLLLTGCTNKVIEYKEVSDIIVGLYNNETYDVNSLSEFQNNLIDDYVYSLTNPEINVSDFINYDDRFKIDDNNTEGIYVRDNKCYIRYNDINFEEAYDHNTEPMAKVVCNGYYTMLFISSIKPVSIDYNNPKYQYRYLGYYEDSDYHFVYRSYYDGSGLIVSISDNVKVVFSDVNNLELKNISNVSYTKYILPGIVLLILICLLIFIKKKYNDVYNN